MRTFLGQAVRAAVVMGGVAAAAGSATSNSNNCKSNSAEPCGAQPESSAHASHADEDEQRAPMPPIERREAIVEERSIAEISVEIQPVGAAAWSVTVGNEGDDTISVLWDESTVVLANGNSVGRMIRGETRRVDTAKTQAPSPVPPHARNTEEILAEKIVGEEDAERQVVSDMKNWGRPPGYMLPRYIKRVVAAREAREQALVGAHLYLVVQMPSGKKTWAGRIEHVAPARSVDDK